MASRIKNNRADLRDLAIKLGLDEIGDLDQIVDEALEQRSPAAWLEKRAATAAADPPESPPADAEQPAPDVMLHEVTAPIDMSELTTHLPHHVDLQLTRHPHLRAKVKRLFLGLQKMEAELANGRPVTSNADAIRWLLENLTPA